MMALLLCCALAPPHRLGGEGLVRHMRRQERAVLIIDANNLRGAQSFAKTQQQLTAAVDAWASLEQLHVILMLDHGPEQWACRTGDHSVVTFAGPTQTADDLIVRDSLWLRQQKQNPVFVITSDAGKFSGLCPRMHAPH